MRTCLNLGACVKSSIIVYHSYSLIDGVWQKGFTAYFCPGEPGRLIQPSSCSQQFFNVQLFSWLAGNHIVGLLSHFSIHFCHVSPPNKSPWATLKSYPFKTGLKCKLDQMTRSNLFPCWRIIISIDLLQLLSFISSSAFYNISISPCLPLSISLARSAALQRGTDARALTALRLCVLMTSRSVQSVSRMRLQTAIMANRRAGEAALMQMCWQGRRSGSFIFFQRERWVNTKVILHEGGTAGDQNTAERIAAKQRTRSWFVPVRSLFFFPT